jgi:hypothetical protein
MWHTVDEAQAEILIATLGTEAQVVGSHPPRYEVAEVLDLQAVRDTARGRRRGDPHDASVEP